MQKPFKNCVYLYYRQTEQLRTRFGTFGLYQGAEEVSIHCEIISPMRGFLVNVLVNIFSLKKKVIRNAVLGGIRTQTLRH